MMNKMIPTQEYKTWIKDLKQKFRQAQIKAAVKINSTLLEFYWKLGTDIIEKQKAAVWGSGFLKQLSTDLTTEFPDIKGFSLRNIKYIRQWVTFYTNDNAIGQQAVAQLDELLNHQLFQIPWGHNLAIISKCKNYTQAIYYVTNTQQNGWSRSVLVHQIESGLWQREGKTLSNFKQTLPALQSDLAQQTLKDPYVFDFLTFTKDYSERELEQGLVKHITNFLLELGSGFAYVGKQVPLQVGQRDFYLDLLFYHTQLHCYVVIELKTTDFEPVHTGKLNFYIKAVDEIIRNQDDKPTIGILLCKNKDRMVAEYALSDINKPIAVSEYQLTKKLPDDLKSSLPSTKEIEDEFNKKATSQ